MVETTDPRWTEGVCGDGTVILYDGAPVPIKGILAALNAAQAAAEACLDIWLASADTYGLDESALRNKMQLLGVSARRVAHRQMQRRRMLPPLSTDERLSARPDCSKETDCNDDCWMLVSIKSIIATAGYASVAPDDAVAAMRDEIARLRDEVNRLEEDLAFARRPRGTHGNGGTIV